MEEKRKKKDAETVKVGFNFEFKIIIVSNNNLTNKYDFNNSPELPFKQKLY